MPHTTTIAALLTAVLDAIAGDDLLRATLLVEQAHRALPAGLSRSAYPRLQGLVSRVLVDTAAMQRRARRRREASLSTSIAAFAHEVDLVGQKLFAIRENTVPDRSM
jgi:hypothetical protein